MLEQTRVDEAMAHLANRNWVIEFKDITLEEELGSGSFGMVYKV